MPLQANSFDCGVYVSIFMRGFIDEVLIDPKIQLENVIPSIKQRISPSWCTQKDVDELRLVLQKLMMEKMKNFELLTSATAAVKEVVNKQSSSDEDDIEVVEN